MVSAVHLGLLAKMCITEKAELYSRLSFVEILYKMISLSF